MKYGYFDDKKREYVIERPDTPAAWSNFLGTNHYGAIITNNAAGYSFGKSAADERLLRFKFNTFAPCMPGRYIYIKDRTNGDYWSASWQPVGKPLDAYKSVCRHGTGYTIIGSEYDKIATETRYYVPLDKVCEVWKLCIRNLDNDERAISVFSYAEFTNDNNELQDDLNLQYTQYISRTYYKNNFIVQSINENESEKGATPSSQGSGNEADRGIFRFFAAAGASVSGWDGSREAFVGFYRSYSNPQAVEKGKCTDSLNYTGNSCGALQIDVRLPPGAEQSFAFILGIGGEEAALAAIDRYSDERTIENEMEAVKDYWHSRLNRFQAVTPDSNLNAMVNAWHPYQCYVNFFWSRTASLIYRSMRNGYGYRDTMSDIMGIMHLDHCLAGRRLRLMLSGQAACGGALPIVGFDHRAGSEPVPGSAEYEKRSGHGKFRCDDALWLFQAVPQYMKESGDRDFLEEVIPYADKGGGTVFEHLKKALLFSLCHLGIHDLPLGLESDWNDCLRLGENGESVFAAFQLFLAFSVFRDFAEQLGKSEDREWAASNRERLYDGIQNHCWEDDRFIRALVGEERAIGSAHDEEAKCWLNPQSWSIISGAATEEQAGKALDTVHARLDTDYGAMLLYPAVRHNGLPVERMVLYLPGEKENGSIFTQAQSYLVLAEAMAGHGTRAWEYYNKSNPAFYNDNAETRTVEPYVYCQFTEGVESPHHGRSHGHWLTGSSATMMTSLVEGIFGLRPDYEGLVIDPCIPSRWKSFTMTRVFRDKKLFIDVVNDDGVEKGVRRIVINGEALDDNFVPYEKMDEENRITVIMGK